MKRSTTILLLVSVMTIMATLTWLQPYTLLDDILYRCVWRASEDAPFSPINSLNDVINSAWTHYLHVNGRMWPHAIAQIFLGLIGKTGFSIVNGIMCGVLIMLTVRYTTNRWNHLPAFLLITTALFLCFPGFVNVYLWVMGAFNYVWTSGMIVLFLILFEQSRGRKIRRTDFFKIVIAFLAGWSHEGLAMPLCLGLWIHTLWINRQEKQGNAAWLYLITFSAGTMLCVLNPAILFRVTGGSAHDVVSLLLKCIGALMLAAKLRIFWLLLFVSVWTFKYRKDIFKTILIRNHGYLFIAILPALALFIVTDITSARVCFGVELYSMLALTPVLLAAISPKTLTRTANIGMAITVLSLIPALLLGIENHRNSDFVEKQLLHAKSHGNTEKTNIIETKALHLRGWIAERYAIPMVEYGPNTLYFAPDENDENIRAAEALNGTKHICFLPKGLLETAKTTETANEIPISDELDSGLLAMRLSADVKVNGVRFILKPDQMPFYKKIFSYRGHSFQAPRYKVLRLENHAFVIFEKPLPKINRRIEKVEIF